MGLDYGKYWESGISGLWESGNVGLMDHGKVGLLDYTNRKYWESGIREPRPCFMGISFWMPRPCIMESQSQGYLDPAKRGAQPWLHLRGGVTPPSRALANLDFRKIRDKLDAPKTFGKSHSPPPPPSHIFCMHLCQLKGGGGGGRGRHLKPPQKFENIFVAVITFFPFLLCK